MTEIPTLHTERLILRGQRPEDTEALMAAYADEAFARYITVERRALTRQEAWRPIAVVAGAWATMGYSEWMVEEREGGAPVGRIGPWQPEGWPDLEIGWAVFPEHQGRGYAIEGAAAAMVWAHEVLGRDHVIHLIDVENRASEKVATALGAEAGPIWDSPLVQNARIWTTHWARFVATPAYQQHLAAATR